MCILTSRMVIPTAVSRHHVAKLLISERTAKFILAFPSVHTLFRMSRYQRDTNHPKKEAPHRGASINKNPSFHASLKHLIDHSRYHPGDSRGVAGGEDGPPPTARLVLDGCNGGDAGEYAL